MFKKISLGLAVLAVLLFAQSEGNPVNENENKDGIQAAATRDSRNGPGDWLHFNHSWQFPSLPSVTNLFAGEDKNEGRGLTLRKRIDALEKGQKFITELLKNLTRDVAALTASNANKVNGSSLVPAKPETNKPEIVTVAPNLTEGLSPAKPTTKKPEIVSGAPSKPEGVVPAKPEMMEDSDKNPLTVSPLKRNEAENLPRGKSRAPEIPEKMVIASTSLEDGPGENSFGSISLVGFAPSHDSRHN